MEGRHGKYTNTGIKSNHETKFIINKQLCFPLQFVSFIEKRKVERLGRRDASGERSSCGGYPSSLWTVFCLLLPPILARL